MFRSYIPFLGILLFSCGTGSDDHNMDLTPEDTLSELPINEERVSAVEFNNELTLMQTDMLDLVEKLFQSDTNEVETNLDNVLFQVEINLADLDEMEFDGSEDQFIKEMKELMTWYKTELQGDFKSIIPLLKKSKLTDAERKQLKAYDISFAEQEEALFIDVFAAQDSFAVANNIELAEQ